MNEKLNSLKLMAKEFIDSEVWSGIDLSGSNNSWVKFTPDELQKFIDDLLYHLYAIELDEEE